MTKNPLLMAFVAFTLFALLLGWAGRDDYRDALLTEMHDNGAYTRLSDAHPEMTDAELIELYIAETN